VTVRERKMVIMEFNYQYPEMSREFTPASSRSIEVMVPYTATCKELFWAFGEKLIGYP
jgi:hypothetical protein